MTCAPVPPSVGAARMRKIAGTFLWIVCLTIFGAGALPAAPQDGVALTNDPAPGSLRASKAYALKVATLIKWTWTKSLTEHRELPYGAVVVGLSVRPNGRVVAPRVLSNNGGKTMARIALHAATKTYLPPMPPEVVTEMHGQRIPLHVTFDYQSMPK